MENSKKHDERLGVNKIGKNKRKIYFQQTIDAGNNITTSQPDFYELHKDEFKGFIKHITGNESNASRPPVPVQFMTPVPRHHVHPITGPILVDKSQSNLYEFPVPTSMRNFQDTMPLNIGNSRGNQFQSYPPQSQAFNNTNVQYHSINQSQERYYPMNHSSQLVNGIHSSQSNYSNQLVNGFPSTQTNVSNLSTSFHATNPTFNVNTNNQLVNGFPSTQTNMSNPLTSFHSTNPTFNVNTNNQLVNGFLSTQTNVSNPSTSFHAPNPTFNVNTNNQLVNGFPSSSKYQENVTRLQKVRPPPLSTTRTPIPVKVPTPIPPSQAPYNALLGHHVQPITRPSLVYNSQNNLVESQVSSFMRNFQEPTLNLGNSRGNQFQLYPPEPQVFNNINVQSQEHFYPMNGSNQVVNGFPSSQTNGSNQLVNDFPSTQTNVSNPSVFLNATSSTLPININNQLVNRHSSSQTKEPLSQTSEFMLTSPNSKMNCISPQSPHRPLLSPNLFSSPSSPEYPFYSHLIPDPPSPLSSNLFPYTKSPKSPDYQ